MRRSPSVWMLGAAAARALGSVVQKPYAMNSTASAIPPPYASGTRLAIPSPLSTGLCDNSSVWLTASVVPYPIVSLPASSLVTPTANLVSTGLSDLSKTQPLVIMPTLSSSAIPTSALQSANSLHLANKAAPLAAIPASSTIDLPLLSSILLSGLPAIYTETRTKTSSVIVSLTVPTSSSIPSSDCVSSSSVATTSVPVTSVAVTSSLSSEASATEFPTLPPFSYNPSASRGSATPISRPTPEPSSANVAGSTLSTSPTPSATGSMEIPPAPSAAGAPGGLSGRGKERVWWVAFLVPFLAAV